MIFLKVRGSKSWLDPKSQPSLSAKLADRLWNRCHGRRGLFVTLTYRRDEYNDPLDLYRTQAEQQHVPLFLRKVSRHLGENLKGRWFCKMEFQDGGWVHWHIIILDVDRIPHDDMTRLWGRGFVWLRRLSEKHVRYCCKYVAKDGHGPAFLYGEPPKAVKIVRVSPGFWGDPIKPKPTVGETRPIRFPFWKPIGDRITECRYEVIARDDENHFQTVKADFGPLLLGLIETGHPILGNTDGWVAADADLAAVDRVVEDRRWAARAAPPAAPQPGGAAALHLIQWQNRDAPNKCNRVHKLQ
jgi:hypothetical protein